MSLRWRVALALILVIVPVAVGFTYFTYRQRREALLEATYDAALARMESGGRERCEEGELRGRGRGRGRRERGPESRLIAGYDASLESRDPDAPRLSPAVAAALRAGEVSLFDPDSARPNARIVLRMPWDEGDCAVLLVRAPRGVVAGAFVRDVLLMLSVLVLALVAATFSLGPPIRRLARLSSAVRAAEKKGLGDLVLPREAAGKDEIGVLADALHRAAENAHTHVTELEARDRALREYVDGTTHDLAIPLTVIQGHLSAIQRQSEAGQPADPKEVRGASASANYLAQLAANLAAAARLDGSTPLEKRPVDLRELVLRVVERLEPIAKHREVELAASVPDDPPVVIGDELLLERAVANLVHNAIRHRKAGTPGHVAVLLAKDPARITVKSDGTPIDDATLTALKSGDVPTDAARTRGRGLGLRIVRRVAELHALTLDFAIGEGDTLEVTLRAAADAARAGG